MRGEKQMNRKEKKAVGLLKALNNLEKKCKIEKVPYKSEIKKIMISLLPEDYGIFEILLNLIEKLQKENEELKEKESRIYKEVQESLSFEKFLIAKDIGPDLFNLGRFYISQIIYDILNNAENPEGIHKENKYIKYIDYIPVQKVKDKIRHYQELQDNYIKKYDEINEGLQAMINVLQELLEGRK